MKRFTTSDGLSLAYLDAGSGTPLLCLPGLTRNANDFDDLAAAIAARRRLIRLTPRGRGASDRDPEFRNYSVAVETRDALELLDHLGIPQAVVIGASRGGLIAMVMAASAKHRMAGAMLVDIGPEIDPEGLEVIMGYLGRPPQLPSFEAVATALRARMGEDFPTVDDVRWLELARRWFREGPDGTPALDYDPRLRDAVEVGSAQPAPDMWPYFDALEGLPLALLRGANSNLLSATTMARMQARRPDMICAEVPDRGHLPFLDEPESMAVLETLLARVGS